MAPKLERTADGNLKATLISGEEMHIDLSTGLDEFRTLRGSYFALHSRVAQNASEWLLCEPVFALVPNGKTPQPTGDAAFGVNIIPAKTVAVPKETVMLRLEGVHITMPSGPTKPETVHTSGGCGSGCGSSALNTALKKATGERPSS